MVKLPAGFCPESTGKRHMLCSASSYGEQLLGRGAVKSSWAWKWASARGKGCVCSAWAPGPALVLAHSSAPAEPQCCPAHSRKSSGWSHHRTGSSGLNEESCSVCVSGPWVQVQGLAICRWKGTCPGNSAKPQDFALKQLPEVHTPCSIPSLVGYSVWQAGGNKQLEERAASALLSEHVSEPWIHLSIKSLIGKCNPESLSLNRTQ